MSEKSKSRQATDPARSALRTQLLAAREQIDRRAERERALGNRVARWLKTVQLVRLAFYWPIRGEPDLAPIIADWLAVTSLRAAGLPVIVGDQLAFAPWTKRSAMVPGAFEIPVPSTSMRMVPQLLLIPCLGFDAQRYRLGYGGGYYDRTLATMQQAPVKVGIAFDMSQVDTIAPRQHDVRLDLVITEGGVL